MNSFIFLSLLLQLTKTNALWPFGANPYITNVFKSMHLSGLGDGVKPLGFRQRLTQDAMMKPGYGKKLNGLLRSGQSSTLPSITEQDFEEESNARLHRRRKTSTTTTSITTTTTTTTSTTTTTTTLATTTRVTTKKIYKKPLVRFYKPKYISLDEMSTAEKHKNSLLNMLKSVVRKNRERKPTRPRFSEPRDRMSFFKTNNLAKIKTTNLNYRFQHPSQLNTKKFGTLVIVNNNNNNNNLIQGLDPIELERFLRAHQDFTITELLHSNITERLKEFFELDQREINEFIQLEKATGQSKRQPVYKLVDLRSKQSHQPLKYTYYPSL
ncbi:hypothetical protein BpHYR1_049456 [Brachionus plicatilis]|uniref:Uncharacterized protein n=1 Tax=Brachionus plicatilis TaxID=10195 RepID=A0A3M7R2W8_BRAPC|nr:hypothetical protein BpHYR1_049456 [Brachionus plicatilis]